MNDQHHRNDAASICASRECSIGEMADAYSRRARVARINQGKPPVIVNAAVLNRIAEIMATGDAQSHPQGLPAA